MDDHPTERYEIPRLPAGDAGQAYLVVFTGGMFGLVHRLRPGETTIGRHPDADLFLRDEGVSRYHARVVCAPDGSAELCDLGSTNGTFVNGRRIDRQALRDGDRIQVGPHALLQFCLRDSLEEQFQQQLFELATRDPLTGIANRRSFTQRFRDEFRYACRHGRPCSLILFDIDRFKAINDACGHAGGDAVLRQVAALVERLLRREDHFARYGGEEFVIVARDLTGEQALARAESLRCAVEQAEITHDGRAVRVTISLGVVTYAPGRFATPESMFEEADRCLYLAKQRGRNRVEGTVAAPT